MKSQPIQIPLLLVTAAVSIAFLVFGGDAAAYSLAKEVDVKAAKGLTSTPDGRVWFVGSKDSRSWNIFRTSVDGPLEKIALGGIERTGRVTAIAVGPDQRVWVAVRKAKPGSRVTVFRIKSPSNYTSFRLRDGVSVRAFAAGPNGRMWFLGAWKRSFGSLGRKGDLRLAKLSGAAKFDQLTAGPEDSMWFAGRDRVVRRELSGKVKLTLTREQPVTDIAVDAADNAWVPGLNAVQRIDPAGSVTRFSLTYPNSGAARSSMATFIRQDGLVGFLAGFSALGTVDHFVASPSIGSISGGTVEEVSPEAFGGESMSWLPNFRTAGYRPGFRAAAMSTDGYIWAATFAVPPYTGLYAIRP